MWVVLGAAAILVLVGAGVLLFAPVTFGTFGWTAYAPLSGETFSFSGMYPLTPRRATGALCVIAGLLLVAGVLGWVLGRRAGRRDQLRMEDQ